MTPGHRMRSPNSEAWRGAEWEGRTGAPPQVCWLCTARLEMSRGGFRFPWARSQQGRCRPKTQIQAPAVPGDGG